MSNKLLAKNGNKGKRPQIKDDAVTSAGGSMAARFLEENKDKGRPLMIPSLNIILYPNGEAEKIKDHEL